MPNEITNEKETKDVWITTDDNPFDPFTQFELWNSFDVQGGYNTCSRVSRLALTTDSLTDQEKNSRILHALNDLCEEGFVVRRDGQGISRYHLCIEGETVPY